MSTAPLSDISVTGARIQATSPGMPGDLVALTLQDIGEIPARIVRQTQGWFAVEFADLDRRRDALIRKVYGGRYAQRPVPVRGHHILHALVARALR